jgi:hypothetical protein
MLKMNELFQKKKAPVAALPVSQKPQQTVEAPAESQVDFSKALGLCKIIHGSQVMECAVAGKTIAYIREALGSVLQVPYDAVTWLNNVKITDETTVLTENASLEFIKAAGTKGI